MFIMIIVADTFLFTDQVKKRIYHWNLISQQSTSLYDNNKKNQKIVFVSDKKKSS